MFCVSKWFAVTVIGIVLCMGGCATTSTRPYLLSPDGIGVAILSPPPAKAAIVESNLVDAEGPAAGGTRNGFGGPLVPLGLIIAPFALAADASVCDQKLDAAYPGLPERISEIGQREFSPADVQDQFVAVLQEGTSVPVAREEIFLGNDKGAGEQQLLAAAAKHARAHIFIVEISNVSLQPFGKGCDSWKIWAKMRIQLWKVADRSLILSFSFGYPQPFVTGPLAEAKSVFDEPGALQSRLKSTYGDAARRFFYRGMFQLPP